MPTKHVEFDLQGRHVSFDLDPDQPTQSDLAPRVHPSTLPPKDTTPPIESKMAHQLFSLGGGLFSSAKLGEFATAGAEAGAEGGAMFGPVGSAVGGVVGGALGGTAAFLPGLMAGRLAQKRVSQAVEATPKHPFSDDLIQEINQLPQDAWESMKYIATEMTASKGLKSVGELLPWLRVLPVARKILNPQSVISKAVSNMVAGGVTGGTEGAQVAGILSLGMGGVHNLREAASGYPKEVQAIKQQHLDTLKGIQQEQALATEKTNQEIATHQQLMQERLGTLTGQKQSIQKELTTTQDLFEAQSHLVKESFRREALVQETAIQATLDQHAEDQTDLVRLRAMAGDKAAMSTRVGGDLHQGITDFVRQHGADAWSKTKVYPQVITNPLPHEEVQTVLRGKLLERMPGSDNYYRRWSAEQTLMRNLKEIALRRGITIPKFIHGMPFDELPPEQRDKLLAQINKTKPGETPTSSYTAQDILDASGKIGESGSKAVKSGHARPTGSDLPNIDARWGAMAVLDHFVPEEFKGSGTEAKKAYQNHLELVDFVDHAFAPNAGTNAATKQATDLLVKLSEGSADPRDQRVFEQLATEIQQGLLKDVQSFTDRMNALSSETEQVKQGGEQAKDVQTQRQQGKLLDLTQQHQANTQDIQQRLATTKQDAQETQTRMTRTIKALHDHLSDKIETKWKVSQRESKRLTDEHLKLLSERSARAKGWVKKAKYTGFSMVIWRILFPAFRPK